MKKTAVMIPARVKNIPEGDPTKELNFQSEHQKEFTQPPQIVYQNHKVNGPTKIKSHILPQTGVDFTTTSGSAYALRTQVKSDAGFKAAVNESCISFGEAGNNPNVQKRECLTSFQLDFKAPVTEGVKGVKSRHSEKPKASSKACFEWDQGRTEGGESISKHDYQSWACDKNMTESAKKDYDLISKTERLANVKLGDSRIAPNRSIAQSSFQPLTIKTAPKKIAATSQVSSIVFGTTQCDYSQSSNVTEFPLYYFAAQKAAEKKIARVPFQTDLKIQSELPGISSSTGPVCTTSQSHYKSHSHVDRTLGKALDGATKRVLFPITDGPRVFSTTGHESYRMRDGLMESHVGPTGPRQYLKLKFGDDRIGTFYRKFPMVVRA